LKIDNATAGGDNCPSKSVEIPPSFELSCDVIHRRATWHQEITKIG
jgi:hypothetical protein